MQHMLLIAFARYASMYWHMLAYANILLAMAKICFHMPAFASIWLVCDRLLAEWIN
jgi:hypothetical protein